MKKITKAKLQELKNKKDIVVFDMRDAVSYRDGHIDGAINAPLRNFINYIMPMQRASIIVCYSDTLNDSDITAGLNYATEMGFTNLRVATYQELK